jgi:hypothetical protein
MPVTLTVDALGRWPLASQAKVSDLKTALEVDEDVGGLEVEVDVSRVVDELDALYPC